MEAHHPKSGRNLNTGIYHMGVKLTHIWNDRQGRSRLAPKVYQKDRSRIRSISESDLIISDTKMLKEQQNQAYKEYDKRVPMNGPDIRG
jgi:hypothetical protein